ncbi:MAG: SHOCT-like domain-containing protein [Chloroflexota bacterium]
MSSEEQKRILKMVEDGKISAEEAMQLIQALGEGESAEAGTETFEAATSPGVERSGQEFDEVRARALRFASIPLWTGVFVTLLSSYWLFTLVQRSNYGFWFVCAWFPLLLGVLLVALSTSGSSARWLYVNVEQAAGDWPGRITLGFPLPLGLASWALRNFGHYARGVDRARAAEVLSLLAGVDSREPIIVNVDEGGRGERVQVYIG